MLMVVLVFSSLMLLRLSFASGRWEEKEWLKVCDIWEKINLPLRLRD